jgi:hypothetical protein
MALHRALEVVKRALLKSRFQVAFWIILMPVVARLGADQLRRKLGCRCRRRQWRGKVAGRHGEEILPITRRIIAGYKLAFGFHQPGRSLLVRPDDTFVVSYGKSGTTWTCFLLANLLHPDVTVTFGNIDQLISDPDYHSKRCLARMPSPRILKSHYCFEPRYPRVIYVVRDPRDVVLSQFHMNRKRNVIGADYPLDKFVTRFIRGETSVYPGSWREHVGNWLAARHGQANFLLLRYEDMQSDAGRELTRVASFVKIDARPEDISRAVARSSADQMRQLEKTSGHLWSTTKDTRQDIPFVRSAKAGRWRYDLPAALAAQIENEWGPLMHWLGYELSSGREAEKKGDDFPESILSVAK